MTSKEFLALWKPFEPVFDSVWREDRTRVFEHDKDRMYPSLPVDYAHEICLHRLTLKVLEKGYGLKKGAYGTPDGIWWTQPNFESALFAAAYHAGLRAKEPEAKATDLPVAEGIIASLQGLLDDLKSGRIVVREAKP